MKRLSLALLVIMAGACSNLIGVDDAILKGRWSGPTAAIYSDEVGLSIWQTNNNGYTTRPVVRGLAGKFDVPGRWWYVDNGQRPPGDSSAHVRVTGSVGHGSLFITVTDVATGRRYLMERLDADHTPLPPPPAPPPPP